MGVHHRSIPRPGGSKSPVFTEFLAREEKDVIKKKFVRVGRPLADLLLLLLLLLLLTPPGLVGTYRTVGMYLLGPRHPSHASLMPCHAPPAATILHNSAHVHMHIWVHK